jgi:NADH-quinone oxidoreductase subunit B
MFTLATVLGPKNPTAEKMIPYECGSESTGGRFSAEREVLLTAILFVVFDIEVVLMYPWAIQFRSLGWTGMATMLSFVALLVIALALRLEERCPRMGELRSERGSTIHVIEGSEVGFATTRADDLLNWAKKYSLFQYPFVTACCAMEFMAMASPRFDMARFGAEAPRFSPRQADLLWIVGTISQRKAPVLRRIYEQMADPKWVLAFGTCASCGGFYDNYTTLPGVDKVIPCDIYVPGCPPRPEAVIDGLLLLQDKIARGDRTPGIVKPRTDPVDAEGLVQLRKQAGSA